MRRKDIQGYEGLYYVTDTGEVWSYDREYTLPVNGTTHIRLGRLLKQQLSTGYPTAFLCKEGIMQQYKVHRLVAIHFIENPKNLPWINHIDGNKKNPNYTNLEWVTPKQNTAHAISTGLQDRMVPFKFGTNHYLSKLTSDDVRSIRNLKQEGLSDRDIAKKFNVTRNCITQIIKKQTWKHVL